MNTSTPKLIKSTVLFVSILLLTWTGLGFAAEVPENRGSLRVVGTAVVTGAPDIAYVTLGVETRHFLADAASQENAETMQQVLAALKELGFTDKEITTSGYNIYSSSQVVDRGTDRETIITNYYVQNRITVSTKDLENVGEIIDQGVKAGANQVQGIHFDIADKEEMQLLALKNAVRQAQAKAGAIAESAGILLGGIASLEEEYGTYVPMVETMALRAGGPSDAATAISPGDVEVSARVTMVLWF